MKKSKANFIFNWIVFLFCSSAYSGGAAQTELINAILSSDLAKVQQILEDPQKKEQIDLHERVANGWNLFSVAAAKGDGEMVQLLLHYGADPTQGIVFDQKQVTPYFLAAQGHHSEAMQLLMASSRFDYTKEIRTALAFGNMALVGQLLLTHSSHSSCSNDRSNDRSNDQANPILHSVATLFSSSCAICSEALGDKGKTKLADGNDRLGEIALTECGHSYCKACLDQWQRISKTCPTCRHPLSVNKIHILKNEGLQFFSQSSGRQVPIPSRDELTQVSQQTHQTLQIPQSSLQSSPYSSERAIIPFTQVNDHPELIPFLGEQIWRQGDLMIGDVVKKRDGSIHYMTQNQAYNYCRSLAIPEAWWQQWWASSERSSGARLPSQRELEDWTRALGRGTPDGYHPHSLPNLEGYEYWSSTRESSSSFRGAYFFDGDQGQVGFEDRSSPKAVRCVVSF